MSCMLGAESYVAHIAKMMSQFSQLPAHCREDIEVSSEIRASGTSGVQLSPQRILF